jgi:hypothetical protein
MNEGDDSCAPVPAAQPTRPAAVARTHRQQVLHALRLLQHGALAGAHLDIVEEVLDTLRLQPTRRVGTGALAGEQTGARCSAACAGVRVSCLVAAALLPPPRRPPRAVTAPPPRPVSLARPALRSVGCWSPRRVRPAPETHIDGLVKIVGLARQVLDAHPWRRRVGVASRSAPRRRQQQKAGPSGAGAAWVGALRRQALPRLPGKSTRCNSAQHTNSSPGSAQRHEQRGPPVRGRP